MKMTRTQFALDAVNENIEQNGRNALIESYFVQYLLVSFYSEVESVLKSIIQNRLSVIEDNRVAKFIFNTNEAMIRRVKKAEINDILVKFGCGDGDVIQDRITDMNLQPYFDAITNRHLVSHAEGCNMTLDYFSKAIPCAERIFLEIESALNE